MVQRAKKILLVEDNSEVRQLLTLFIKRLGYEVFEAATGVEAIERASTVRPDLIMMDFRLPGMNGDQATARLKAKPSTRDIPVVITTGYSADVQIKRFFAAGATEILLKPIDLTALGDVLRRCLSAKKKKKRIVKRY